MGKLYEVISTLAAQHGYKVESLAKEIEDRGCYPAGSALLVFTGLMDSCPRLVPLIAEILSLEEDEEEEIMDAVMERGRIQVERECEWNGGYASWISDGAPEEALLGM